MFVYVLGGAIHAGVANYVDYLLPGILLITIAYGVSYTAFRLFTDISGGMFERFQSMPIARSAVLWSHVLTSMVANLASLVLVVVIAVAMGFRSGAGILAWLAVVGILLLFMFALTWLAVIPGLTARSADGVSGFSYPLIFMPFLSSAFVPTSGMPGPVRAFAEHQPVTPVVDTLRSLLAGRPAMLTISQLAAYAGVTVRAVRHYHAKGLLREPERDHSGYRRYDAADVVELIKIRTLAQAGVPLSRVGELLEADDHEFTAAVRDIDRRLRAEIRQRQHHRNQIAKLAAGDSLALPADAVAYLNRMRELGFRERLVGIERDSWILIAARIPEQVPAMMRIKHAQIENDTVRRLYLDIGDLADCAPHDPRLPELADRVVAFIEAAADAAAELGAQRSPIDRELIALLDAAFVESFPRAARLLELLELRGWTGWTDIRRIQRAT